MYMLDTNICIFLIKSKSLSLAKKIASIPEDQVFISTIVQSELEYGVAKSQHPTKNTLALTKFLSTLNILPFDSKASIMYGEIRADLERKGIPIGHMDTLIVAHAKSAGLVCVTNNTREFERVNGLLIEDWSKE
jgi:tRNA(fMet)-specific endonuclease VapC